MIAKVYKVFLVLTIALTLLGIFSSAVWAQYPVIPPPPGCVAGQMRCVTPADRAAAAARAAIARKKNPVKANPVPGGTPDYFGIYPNYAFSPILPKFVDALPGFCGASPNASACIPVAVKDTTTYPGSDYYQIGLQDYSQQFHSSLPATKLRGYYDMKAGADNTNHYLGPFIIARRDVPVRVKFTNNLGLGALGNLFIPVDTTYMGAGAGPLGGNYTQNRATLHLHGGVTPWISDGTPHQWITPAGEATIYKKGVSFQNVPDMVGAGKSIVNPSPGDGMGTFYWPNQQSGRLMFYHDHALGITRLNVYAGEASGYLLTDSVEDGLITSGVLPNQSDLGPLYNYGIPLVIQDKTFVPDAVNLAAEDPTWNWGPMGSLWYTHVYIPNQNPADESGVNAMGRWDYGPWFWPAQDPSSLVRTPVLISQPGVFPAVWAPGIPDVSGTPESFMDTPIVNGRAYPYLTVAPKAYRFRILNAANDRTLNLQLYYADPAAQSEVKMVPATAHTAASVPPLCAASNLPATPNSGLTVALSTQTGLAAGCWPNTWPADGRDGGVPDPLTAGPAIIQIGTEGGLMPAPAVIPSTPIGYEYNRRNIVVLSVANHGLLLGPAERADVIVDFSSVPNGSNLILYNDAPAPVPAFDPRIDFYTGDQDQTLATGNKTGGAPTTIAGFGPNTRTIMQFRVSGTAATPFNLTRLQAALPGAYAASQPPPVVPEKDAGYDAAFGTVTSANTYSRIQDTSLISPIGNAGSLATVVLTAYGSGYTATPAVTISGGGTPSIPATATVTVTGGLVSRITITNPGAGYTSAPTVTIAPPTTGVAATAFAVMGTSFAMGTKAIQELFTFDYGRMNATLGVELPFTNFATQTTIPYGYVDPPTEAMTEDVPQVWKITHNGVDTHFIHFHLFDVQVINRVGWDGQVRPPDANELGWKETVRMSPLEDAIVAFKAVAPKLPFAIPDSWRLLDPTRPDGATNAASKQGFMNIDPNNNPVTTINALTNFGWEYVWHCHILGHEENDMMRPMVFSAKAQLLTPTPGGTLPSASSATFTWASGAGVTATYLWVGTALGGNTLGVTAPGTASAATVNGLPPNNVGIPTVYVRLFSVINGVTSFNDYTYAPGIPTPAVMISPVPGTVLPTGSPTFTYTAGFGATMTWFYIGTTLGGKDLGSVGGATSYTPPSLPSDGSTIYVTLYSQINGVYVNKAYTYTASRAVKAVLVSPTPGGTLPLGSVTFGWTTGTGVTMTWFYIGTTAGSNNLGSVGGATSYTTSSLPSDGSTIYVTLYSQINGAYVNNTYTYTASTAPAVLKAAMISPVNGTHLAPGATVTFNYTAGTGVTMTWFYLGTTAGAKDLGSVGGATSFTKTLPSTAGIVYATIYSQINGAYVSNSYSYPTP